MLSVQVHPSDAHPELIPAGDTAKTEASVVIEAEKGSQIYAGLKSGTTAGSLRESLNDGTIAEQLVSISPKPGVVSIPVKGPDDTDVVIKTILACLGDK